MGGLLVSDAGRKLFTELLPSAPPDLFDRIGQEMRDWYIEEEKRRDA